MNFYSNLASSQFYNESLFYIVFLRHLWGQKLIKTKLFYQGQAELIVNPANKPVLF